MEWLDVYKWGMSRKFLERSLNGIYTNHPTLNAIAAETPPFGSGPVFSASVNYPHGQFLLTIVGLGGFEPPASWSRTVYLAKQATENPVWIAFCHAIHRKVWCSATIRIPG